MKDINLKLILTTLMFFFIVSCGYKFAGGGNLPNDIKTINVKIFKNMTEETGLENIFTNDMIYELTQNGKFSSDNSTAGGVLSGVLKSLTVISISRQSEDVSLERRVTLTADLKLVDKNGIIIWMGTGIKKSEAYSVSENDNNTRANRKKAITTLSINLAEKVFNRLTDTF